MKAVDVLMVLRRSATPVLRVSEAQAILGVTPQAASKALHRLAEVNAITQLTQGLYWVAERSVELLLVPRFLTLPFPSYVSMYTALYFRGVLSQMSPVIYCVTLGRARKINASVATYAFRHIHPSLFGGYETLPDGAFMASTEKALFDLAYFSAVRDHRLGRLPELELPAKWDRRQIQKWIAEVTPASKQKQVRGMLDLWLPKTKKARPSRIKERA